MTDRVLEYKPATRPGSYPLWGNQIQPEGGKNNISSGCYLKRKNELCVHQRRGKTARKEKERT